MGNRWCWGRPVTGWYTSAMLSAPPSRSIFDWAGIFTPPSIIQPANRMWSRTCASQTERGWSEGFWGSRPTQMKHALLRLCTFGCLYSTPSANTQGRGMIASKATICSHIGLYSVSVSLIGSYFRPRVCPIFRENILHNTLTIKIGMVSGLY